MSFYFPRFFVEKKLLFKVSDGLVNHKNQKNDCGVNDDITQKVSHILIFCQPQSREPNFLSVHHLRQFGNVI